MFRPWVDENSARIAKQYAASLPLPLVLAGRRYRSCAAPLGFSAARVTAAGVLEWEKFRRYWFSVNNPIQAQRSVRATTPQLSSGVKKIRTLTFPFRQ